MPRTERRSQAIALTPARTPCDVRRASTSARKGEVVSKKDVAGLHASVDNFCHEHPLEPFGNAAIALIEELAVQRGKGK
jgi:hypothetical protein